MTDNSKTYYECNIQHSGVDRNGREFCIDGNADFVQDEIFSMFRIDKRYQQVFIERFIDFGIWNNLAYIINAKSFYKDKYFDFFYDIFSQEYYHDDEDLFKKFMNKKDYSIIYMIKNKDYRFEEFIKDTKYRLYYNYEIELFDYDKTIADLYEKYYYLRIIILRDINLYGTSKVNYEECDRILQELAKEFKYPYKKNGFYDKFQLGRLGENYYIWQK